MTAATASPLGAGPSRGPRLARLAPAATLAAGYGLALGLAPAADGPVTCLLRLHADQACPGCGMSRAVGRVVRGDLAAAVAYHPWVLALVLQAVVVAVWASIGGSRLLNQAAVRWGAWLLTANAVALVVVWVLRIATGHLDHVY